MKLYITKTDTVGVYCTSSETKPTGDVIIDSCIHKTVGEGSEAYEIDTGKVYLFNGTTWVHQFTMRDSE